MTTTTTPAVTQVYKIWIRATRERIWAAITDPERNRRYGFAAPSYFDLSPRGSFRSIPNDGMIAHAREHGYPMPDPIADGVVLEADPPRLLIQTWRLLMDPATAAEPFSTLTYLIEEATQPGTAKLTVTHHLPDAPATAAVVAGVDEAGAGGGWAWILSDLKSFLETGSTFND